MTMRWTGAVAVLVMVCLGAASADDAIECSSMNVESECHALHDFYNSVKKEDGSPLDWPFDGSNHCMWQGLACDRKYRVSKLDMHDYKLSGTLPNSIGDLKFLARAYLTSNKFHGTIPESVTSLENLKYLDLAHNELTGQIPGHIGNLKSLRWLYLNSNKFSGTIPEDISKLDKLWNLSLQYNQLTGPIPDSFGAGLKAIEHLTLHANKLDHIPNSFCECTEHLVECRLQENSWTCPEDGKPTDGMPTCATQAGSKCDACGDKETGPHTGSAAASDHREL